MLNAAIAGAAGVDQENRLVKETLPSYSFLLHLTNRFFNLMANIVLVRIKYDRIDCLCQICI